MTDNLGLYKGMCVLSLLAINHLLTKSREKANVADLQTGQGFSASPAVEEGLLFLWFSIFDVAHHTFTLPI